MTKKIKSLPMGYTIETGIDEDSVMVLKPNRIEFANTMGAHLVENKETIKTK